MKKVIIWLINIYQSIPTRAHSACVFLPTCSEYTKQAVSEKGPFLGLWLGFKRVLSCHPWQKNHYDPLK